MLHLFPPKEEDEADESGSAVSVEEDCTSEDDEGGSGSGNPGSV